ncbi:MAG: site-specific DNA-methyltransferase, partial [Actinobacteria bacterium]|nr:site-specific DNA-methyltransferase [Actinomycetota bacterium]
MAGNFLYYGDNLDVLRRYVKDESVDLVYLDPPFNSNATYSVLFGHVDGTKSAAQIQAFEDTWSWDEVAAKTFQDTVKQGGRVAEALVAFRTLIPESTMLAYLSMMAPRLTQLRRVLKLTGSLYLHCDPTASHYLKLLLDAVFGPENFRSEIIWKRTTAHSSAKRFGPVHDVILYYVKSAKATWNPQVAPHSEKYLTAKYRYQDERGTYRLSDLTGSGIRHGESGDVWRGFDVTAKGRHWMHPPSELEMLDADGRVYWPPKGGFPAYKRYLEKGSGRPLQDVWTDIDPINSQALERLGYPTQKPVALMDRIILASTDPGGVVLDPFCGCGTTIAAAEKLKRHWIGIDLTALAISLIKSRLTAAGASDYKVFGEPTTADDAEELAKTDPYGFQWWALGLIGARPAEGKKGADHGIDGRLFFFDDDATPKQVIVSVKAGKVSVPQVRDLVGVLDREKAQ